LLFAFALGFDFGFGAAFLTAAFFAGAFFAGAFFAAFFTAGFAAFLTAFFTAFFTAFLAAFFTAFFAAFFAGFFLVAMFVLSSKVCVALEESHNLTPNFRNYQSSSIVPPANGKPLHEHTGRRSRPELEISGIASGASIGRP